MWGVVAKVASRIFNLLPVKAAITKGVSAAGQAFSEAGGAIRQGFTNMFSHAGEAVAHRAAAQEAGIAAKALTAEAQTLGTAARTMTAFEAHAPGAAANLTSASAKVAADAATLQSTAVQSSRAVYSSLSDAASAPIEGLKQGVGLVKSAVGHIAEGTTKAAGHVWNSPLAKTLAVGEIANQTGATDKVMDAGAAAVSTAAKTVTRALGSPAAAVPKM